MQNGGGRAVPMASLRTRHVLRRKHKDEVHQQPHICIRHSVTSVSCNALYHKASALCALVIPCGVFRQNSGLSSHSITVTTYHGASHVSLNKQGLLWTLSNWKFGGVHSTTAIQELTVKMNYAVVTRMGTSAAAFACS